MATNMFYVYNFLALAGFLVLCRIFIFPILRAVYTTYIGPFCGYTVDLASLGKWAVVTGSTDGLGKAYAKELARCGMDVVLISRCPEKLESVAAEIELAYKVRTKTIAVDFTHSREIYSVIKAGLDGLEIGVLVNNVGMLQFGLFTNYPDGEKLFQDTVLCNITSVVMMTRLILPKMVERRKGAVLNIASLASPTPAPYFAVYGGSKAFVDKFTMDLQLENRDTGVIFQSVLPGFIATKMIRKTKGSLYYPCPDDYVRSQLASVGLQIRTAGYGPHRLQLHMTELGNFFVPFFLDWLAMRWMKGVYLKMQRKYKKMGAGKEE